MAPSIYPARQPAKLLVAGKSVAPNTFVLGLDAELNVMVVHQLVATKETHPRQSADPPA